ncbi:MAG: hypothetical protein GWM90_06275 [Gemmatimonadetes bacterium]|nr:chemotaxis protein CheW [Gemmatimonadota bacterium]NIQ53378.1 chemotaxis protein CheW [Gemmatimonadota bacterium]NIU73521.1 hypothetical protein [Gammaproteobacteria bacterium]NIX43730.1 hypothetical protein [Gemmatimonadota bacterium]NIY07923.1 hypothetical protein [Gemmatimonadota bacterium]
MPGADPDRVVVWRAGEAVLALPVESVIEVAEPGGDGRVRSRAGPLEPMDLPGLPPDAPRWAVVVRARRGAVALAADSVEGVTGAGPVESAPGWLGPMARDHLRGLVRLTDGRIAAVPALEDLPTSS